MSISDTPLQFTVTNGDLFTFTHDEIHGIMYPSHDKIGSDEWVWALSKVVINRLRDDAGELLKVTSETVIVSEGYASTAAEAAHNMRACLLRLIEKARPHAQITAGSKQTRVSMPRVATTVPFSRD